MFFWNSEKKMKMISAIGLFFVLLGCSTCVDSSGPAEVPDKWELLGEKAAVEALNLIKGMGADPVKGGMIVLTNAGYVDTGGESTEEVLDGLVQITGTSRGKNSLIEMHTAFWSPMWVAVYDKTSGLCAYLQLDSHIDLASSPISEMPVSELFPLHSVEDIKASHIFSRASDFKTFFETRAFGGNEFRITAVVNAADKGVPGYVLRTIEFHDHFCPGIISGIMMAEYLKKNFPPDADDKHFILSVDPWCKEDALLVLLNATPGKKAYALSYPNASDKAQWAPEVQKASTLVFRQASGEEAWRCLILGFEWPETKDPGYGNDTIDKLYRDLWYLDRLNQPEEFIKVLKRFELPYGSSPQDLARPGTDPFRIMGLIEK